MGKHSPNSKALPSSKIYHTNVMSACLNLATQGTTAYLTTAFAWEGDIIRFHLGVRDSGRGIHGGRHLESGSCSACDP